MKNSHINLTSFVTKNSKKTLSHKLHLLTQQTELRVVGPLATKDTKLRSIKFRTDDLVLLVDTYLPLPKTQSLSLGDGDSVSLKQHKNFDYQFPTQKDFTDFEAALKLLKKFFRGKKLHLHGFWGGRFDHQHVVLCQIYAFLLQHKNISQVTFYHASGKASLEIFNAGKHYFNEQIPFSILSPHRQKITLRGKLQYAGNFLLQANSGLGLSNQSLGKWSLKCTLPIWKYRLSNT